MKFDVQRIGKNVAIIRQYVIEYCHTNCIVIHTDESNFVIDTGFGSESARIISEQIDANKRTFVVNTHYHWDHVWGNAYLAGALLIGHDSLADLMVRNWTEMLERNQKYLRGSVELRKPDMTFDSTLIFPNDGIELFHSPGHTADCISLYYRNENMLIVGDNIGNDSVEIMPKLQCTKEEYRSSIQRYIDLRPELVLSAHNEIVKLDFLQSILKRLDAPALLEAHRA